VPFPFFTREDEDGWSGLDVSWIVDTAEAVGSLVVLDCGLGTFFSFPLPLLLLVPDDEGDEDGESDLDLGWIGDSLLVESVTMLD